MSDKAILLSTTLLFFFRIILAIPADFSLFILSLELDLSKKKKRIGFVKLCENFK